MKIIKTIIFILPIIFGIVPDCEAMKPKNEEYTIENLLDAIAIKESNGDSNAVGDNGRALGAFQIWEIYVKDVNRILGEKAFKNTDRLDYYKSRTMTKIYLEHYGKGKSLFDMARIHNGGLNGCKKEATRKYAEAVIKIMKSKEN
ncbi:MAG: transglycosylase SLT domain-containing protein [Candidatus Micrarchaeia archaeon]|jgi:hypothetical protein